MCLTGSDFYSPQKQQHGVISGENRTINGNRSSPEHTQYHDVYAAGGAQNGRASEVGGHSQRESANSADQMCGVLKQEPCPPQSADESGARLAVKSLLRAMLAKPRSSDVASLMDLSARSEFDSGSEDTLEQSALGPDGKDDDSQSASRDDTFAMELEPDLPGTGHGWSSSSLASPEKASRCPYCLKVFRYRSSYRRHVKIHEGIFSHECTVCMRKFTRKEHYVRHKCDRRPNKPYNVTHDAFRRMSASEKAAARQLIKSAIDGGASDGHSPLALQSQPADVPLELTSGKQFADGPMLLFSGGSVSSMVNSMVPPPPLDAICPLAAMTGSGGLCGVASGSQTVAAATGASPSDLLRAVESSALPHNESRRKSSTPRKVVTADAGRTTEQEGCRLNHPPSGTSRLGTMNAVPVSVMD